MITLPAKRGRPRKLAAPSFSLEEHVEAHEAARRLCLCSRTVRRMVKAGKLPGVKPAPNRLLIPVRAIVDWLEAHRVRTS